MLNTSSSATVYKKQEKILAEAIKFGLLDDDYEGILEISGFKKDGIITGTRLQPRRGNIEVLHVKVMNSQGVMKLVEVEKFNQDTFNFKVLPTISIDITVLLSKKNT